MTPLGLLTWVGAVAACFVIVFLAAAMVAALLRSIARPEVSKPPRPRLTVIPKDGEK